MAPAPAGRRTGWWPTVALAAALCAAPLAAAAQDALLDEASARLARQDAAGAYTLLAAAEAARAGTPRFDYLLGIAALDAGHVTRAIFALERAVLARPDDALARAELGRAYLAAGDADRAREALRQARGGGAPGAVAAAIDRVLGVIDQVVPPTGPRFAGHVEVGFGHDTNVNSATNQGEFAIPGFGGILFQTAPDSRQQSDWVGTAGGGLTAELALSPAWKLVGSTQLRASAPRVVDELDTVLVDTTAGVRHTQGRHSQTVALQNGTAWVGGSPYRNANGVIAQWQTQLAESTQGSLFGQWSRQRFDREAERSNHRALVGAGLAQAIASGPLVYGSAYVARERTADPVFAHLGHRAAGLRLGAEHRLVPTVTLFVEGQHEHRRHAGTEPVFDTRREDRQQDVSAGVRHQAADRWEVVTQVRHTRVRSNVVLYDHTRTVAQITLRRSFP